MTEFLKVLEATIPLFGIIVAGIILRRRNWLTSEADESLLRVVINVLFPCLVFDSMLGNAAVSRPDNLLLAPAVGFGTVCLGLVLAKWAAPAAGLTSARERGTFGVTIGIYNYGYIPLPLALMLFGENTAAVLFVHNVGVEAAMWTLGVIMLGGTAAGGWKRLLNAPLLSIALALALNLTRLDRFIPNMAWTAFGWLGKCAIPMALILIGAVVADHLSQFHTAAGWKVIGFALLLRILVLPMMFLLLARYLPASLELKRVMVLEAAMPAAVFPIVMSRVYGGDPPTALRVVIGTSVAGMVTIPFWIQFGLRFVILGTGHGG